MISRRQLLTGAGAAALFLERRRVQAQAPSRRTIVFSHTTVVTVDAAQEDVALAVDGDKIAAIGATDPIVARYRGAEIYDGRGKALVCQLADHRLYEGLIDVGQDDGGSCAREPPCGLSPHA